jgi:hypothetical protein
MVEGQTRRTYIADIEGGQAPTELLPDKNITIDDIWKTYRWYPGFAEMHDLAVKAIWANGLTDETIKEDRILELKDGHLFAYLAGYTAFILNTFTDPPSVESWHPVIDGIGFRISEVAEDGYPIEIEISQKLQEIPQPLIYKVPNYPVETVTIEVGKNIDNMPLMREIHIRDRPLPEGYGFFILRNRRGLRGIRGLPEYMPLMHPIRAQHDIVTSYTPYAKKQGMGFPVFYLADNTTQRRSQIDTAMSSMPQSNRYFKMGNEDLVEWIQPLAGSYDPFPILQWIDMLIARKTQMNKLMLEGDPAGHLSASETAINNWEREVKESQRFWASQFMPIFKVLGAKDDCTFQDPTRPAFISLMEGIKAGVEALLPIAEPDDIMKIINEYLERSGKKWKLRAKPREEIMQQQQGGEDNGNSGKPDQDRRD